MLSAMLNAVEGSPRPVPDAESARQGGARPLGAAEEVQGRERVRPGQPERARPGQPEQAKPKVAGDSFNLSPEAKAQVAKLQARDAEVRAHEAAHLAAGGGVTRGGASFSYQQGPDGRSYANGGEVSVDTSPVANNPQATIAKANAIRAAALAPASPSPQDQSVAAAAGAMASKAAAELAKTASAGGAQVLPGGSSSRPVAGAEAASGAAEKANAAPPAPGRPKAISQVKTTVRPGALLDLMA